MPPKKKKSTDYLGCKIINNHALRAQQLSAQRKELVKGSKGKEDEVIPDYSAPVVSVRRKLQMSVLPSNPVDEMFDRKALEGYDKVSDKFEDVILFPRRPSWSEDFVGATALAKAEEDSFMGWRKLLEKKYGTKKITPYEKNLNLWRQLWHVMEKSNVLCQVVDCRDPLFYYCKDMQAEFLKLSKNNKAVVLLNKADLLSREQRKVWLDYFKDIGIYAFFWTNINDNDVIVDNPEDKLECEKDTDDLIEMIEKCAINDSSSESDVYKYVKIKDDDMSDQNELNSDVYGNSSWENFSSDSFLSDEEYEILDADQFFNFLSDICGSSSCLLDDDNESFRISIGMVGFPNVGKSSTLNNLIGAHKLAISETPGKTKHFQTFLLSETVELIDCPGLVFPSFCDSSVDLTLSGVISIDNIRNALTPVKQICKRIPRRNLEQAYNIAIPQTKIDEPEYCTAEEFASALAYCRGLKETHRLLNLPTACKIIIKDYISGKVLFCKPPPGTYSAKDFNKWNVNVDLCSKKPLSKEQRDELCKNILRGSNLVSELEIEAINERKFLAKNDYLTPNVKSNRDLKIGRQKKKKQKLRKKYKGLDGSPYDV